ncbi:unnamed protein product [Choristocarpus tenellus]
MRIGFRLVTVGSALVAAGQTFEVRSGRSTSRIRGRSYGADSSSSPNHLQSGWIGDNVIKERRRMVTEAGETDGGSQTRAEPESQVAGDGIGARPSDLDGSHEQQEVPSGDPPVQDEIVKSMGAEHYQRDDPTIRVWGKLKSANWIDKVVGMEKDSVVGTEDDPMDGLKEVGVGGGLEGGPVVVRASDGVVNGSSSGEVGGGLAEEEETLEDEGGEDAQPRDSSGISRNAIVIVFCAVAFIANGGFLVYVFWVM